MPIFAIQEDKKMKMEQMAQETERRAQSQLSRVIFRDYHDFKEHNCAHDNLQENIKIDSNALNKASKGSSALNMFRMKTKLKSMVESREGTTSNRTPRTQRTYEPSSFLNTLGTTFDYEEPHYFDRTQETSRITSRNQLQVTHKEMYDASKRGKPRMK